MAQREAVRAQLALEGGAEDARLDAGCTRERVDLEHAIEPAEIDRDGAAPPEIARLDTAHHARAAAVGDGREARARAPIEQRGDVGLAAREGD